MNGNQIGYVEVKDPFHTTRVTLGWWTLMKMAFKFRDSQILVAVRPSAGAIYKWFKPKS